MSPDANQRAGGSRPDGAAAWSPPLRTAAWSARPGTGPAPPSLRGWPGRRPGGLASVWAACGWRSCRPGRAGGES